MSNKFEDFDESLLPSFVTKEILKRIEVFIYIEEAYYKEANGESASQTRHMITTGMWGEGVAAYYMGLDVWKSWLEERKRKEIERTEELASGSKKRPADNCDIPALDAEVKAAAFTGSHSPQPFNELIYKPKSKGKVHISTGVQKGLPPGSIPRVVLYGWTPLEDAKASSAKFGYFPKEILRPMNELKDVYEKESHSSVSAS